MKRNETEIDVKHDGTSGLLISTLAATRLRAPCSAAADARFGKYLDEAFSASAFAHLPEVTTYKKLREQLAGIEADQATLCADEKEAESSYQNAFESDDEGEGLAVAIAKTKQRHDVAANRLRAANVATRLLQDRLAKAEAAARAAVLEKFRTVDLPRIQAEQEAATHAAREKLRKAALPILDELAVLDETDFLLDSSANIINGRANEMLRTILE